MLKIKDSGIQWIGEIPQNWKMTKVKRIFDIGRGRVISTTELCDTGYPVYSSQTKNNGILGYIKTYDFDRSQLTWTTDGVNAGTVFLRKGKHNCTNVCGTLMPKNNLNNLDYLKYILGYIAFFHKRVDINGFKIMNNEMAEIDIITPPINEQEKIAGFLDNRCSEIDKIIAKTKSTIEEYKKLKQSIITTAVTKGIIPNRPMKDSGIQWIGEIPQEWNIKNLKHFFLFGKGLPITKANLKEKGISVISYGQIHSKLNDGISIIPELIRYVDKEYLTTNPLSLVRKNDFIFADTSEDLNGCGNCVYNNLDILLFAGYHTIILQSRNKAENKYFAYLFKSDLWRKQIREKVTGVKLFSISQKILKSTLVIVPDTDEQQEITNYLDKKCSEIDKLIKIKEKLLQELENYKKSLIYEYVTGKKEII